MACCTIYYPGLLGPDVNLDNLDSKEWPKSGQLPNLHSILFRGKPEFRSRQGIEADILSCLGVKFTADAELPVGVLRNRSSKDPNTATWCLDPVCVQIDRDEALLVANESLRLDESEARSIIDDLNKHFHEDGFKIYYHSDHQWLLSGDLNLLTSSLNDVMFKNIYEYQPAGEDETKWRSVINEVQMLLHMHPVNEARMDNGDLPVNSLWLWGGGRFTEIKPNVDLVVADSSFVRDMAAAAGIECLDEMNLMPGEKLAQNNSLLVFTQQFAAIRDHDVFAWWENLLELDNRILAPLFEMIEKNELDMLVLKSDTVAFKVSKKDLKRPFWHLLKPKTSFKQLICKLRKQNGF
jgi:hypothetical protein